MSATDAAYSISPGLKKQPRILRLSPLREPQFFQFVKFPVSFNLRAIPHALRRALHDVEKKRLSAEYIQPGILNLNAERFFSGQRDVPGLLAFIC